MTPSEHYDKAEELIEEAAPLQFEAAIVTLTAAQVHATLATVARRPTRDGMPG